MAVANGLLFRSSGLGDLGLGGIALGVLASETLHATCGIEQLLLAGEKRMAMGADFHMEVALVGRPRRETIAARAQNADFVVRGMNGCLHIALNLNSNPLILQERPEIQQPSKSLIVRLLSEA
jgi:hypothetical protein